jgi:hypothetical protein
MLVPMLFHPLGGGVDHVGGTGRDRLDAHKGGIALLLERDRGDDTDRGMIAVSAQLADRFR